MGTVNWDNLAEYAQNLLNRIDPDDLDPDTLDALEDAAAGVLPPGATAARPFPPEPTPPNQSRVREDANPRPSELGTRASGLGTRDSQPLTHNPPLTAGEVVGQVETGHEQVTHAESGPTTSSPLKRSKKCAAQNKRTGNQCRAWATHTGYCVFHDPELADAVSQMRAKGGRAPRRVLVGEARKLNFEVLDRAGIQAIIAQALRLQLLGTLTPRQASHTVKLLGLLVSNAREMPHSEESRATFEQSTRELVDLTDSVVEHLQGRDLTDRVNAIQDAGSRREEILKANDRFAPRPTYRSARDYPY